MDRNGCRDRSRNPTAREMDILVQRDVSDDEFEPVWARLDAYDSRCDDGFNEVYPAILADIYKHPTDWQLKGPRTHSNGSGRRDSGCWPTESLRGSNLMEIRLRLGGLNNVRPHRRTSIYS